MYSSLRFSLSMPFCIQSSVRTVGKDKKCIHTQTKLSTITRVTETKKTDRNTHLYIFIQHITTFGVKLKEMYPSERTQVNMSWLSLLASPVLATRALVRRGNIHTEAPVMYFLPWTSWKIYRNSRRGDISFVSPSCKYHQFVYLEFIVHIL